MSAPFDLHGVLLVVSIILAPAGGVKIPLRHGRVAFVESKDEANNGKLFTYTEAKQYCEKQGARLFLPRSKSDHDAVVTNLTERYKKLLSENDKGFDGFFVDLRKATAPDPRPGKKKKGKKTEVWSTSDGRHIWVGLADGKEVDGAYTNWQRGKRPEPTGTGDGINEECVKMVLVWNWKWADIVCSNRNGIVTVCESTPSRPSRPVNLASSGVDHSLLYLVVLIILCCI